MINVKNLIILAFLIPVIAACQPSVTSTPQTVVETLVVTEVIEATHVEVVKAVTPTPEAAESRTLVICQNAEPENFNDGTLFSTNILAAIFDGPINENLFGYQPVIFEKLPNLADGDAEINQVVVVEGDKVVDAFGDVVELAASAGILLVPAGGGDVVLYEGGEFEMDQLSATFQLLPGLMWSDGMPLTSADSVYAFNLAADPDFQADPFIIERTTSYTASDDLTITWTGLPGYMDAAYSFNFFGPQPEHIWGKFTPAGLIDNEQWDYSPVGWGPYKMEEWIRGDRIILHKNPYYFRADEGLPVFDTVVYRFVGTDSNTNIASLLSGECDILATLSGLDDDMERVLELHDQGKINATFTTGTSWSHIDFGIQHREYDDGYQIGVDRPDFFSDVRTRRAFAMCMDRQAMVDELFYSQTMVIDSFLPPQHPYYNPEVVHYDFDIAAGSALLEEVGWMDHDDDPSTPRVAMNVKNVVDGTELIVALGGVDSALIQHAFSIFQKSLAECGIQADIQYFTREVFYGDVPEGIVFGRKFDLVLFAWWTGSSPPCDLFISNLTPGPSGETWTSIQDGEERVFGMDAVAGQNNSGFADADYDAACMTALGSLPGQPEYKAAHMEAQRIFSEQLPIVPLALVNKLAATRPDMCGFIMDPTANSEFWNIEEFDYGEGCEE